MFIYRTKEGQFETNFYSKISFKELHSLNDKPAFEDLITGYKQWYIEGKIHRETGPARIFSNGNYSFWLNGKKYENVNDWLLDNPNKDITFQAFMRLKYT